MKKSIAICRKENRQPFPPVLRNVLLLLFTLLFQLGRAQERITGTVSTADSTVAGATVQVKGTRTSTQTDRSGKFSINARPGATILVSFTGFITQEVKAVSGAPLTVELKPNGQQLDQVVVVGYGTQKKETLTGSISTVSGKEIVASPSPNITSSLAGRLPGLTVNQRSGEPGRDDPAILIRGIGTTGDNSPLIIIDGVQRSLLGRLNPQDIESVTVLKDASAAIYGARAANGVILITTKRGAKGKADFTFNYNYAFQSPTKVPDILDAATFAQVYNEGDFYRKGRPTNYTPFYSADAIRKYADGSDPVLYPNTNWVGEVVKPYSYLQNVNLQVNGGSDKVRYLLSFGTVSQDGNFKYNPTFYKQYNGRIKVDINLTDNLSVGANLYAILNNRTYSSTSTGTNFINILQANPTVIARYPNGLIGPGRLGENPLLQDQVGTDKIDDAPLYSSFTASYKVPFIKGLQLDGSFNYDLSNQFEKLFRTPYSYYEYNVNTQQYDKKSATVIATTELTDTYRKYVTLLSNLRITYDKKFLRDHHITALLGTEQQRNTFSFASAYRKNFVSSAIPQINVGSTAPADQSTSGSASATAYNNFFGRLNYDFLAKYLFEFVFRYDGSQIFPQGKQYGFFPGVSAGWRLSEEPFIKRALPYVTQLKLRASYGQLGNDRVGAYQYLQSFSFGNNYVFGTGDVPGIYANTMPNPNITWEVSKKTDLGLQGDLWNGKLGFDFTFWTQKRSRILAQRNLSVSNVYGFSGLPSENIGKVDSKGIEMVLSHRSSAGKLHYNLSGNLSFSKSKIIFLDEAPRAQAYQNLTGRPIGSTLYYQADGIFHTQDELNKYPHGAGAQVGDIKVVDINGDGVIDSKDQIRVDLSATPQIVFGLSTNFNYKGFDLNVLFQGQTRAYNYDGTAANLGSTDFSNDVTWRANNRWTVTNPNGTQPRADAWQPGNTTFFLFDATFVRLKTIELGYSLPENLLAKTRAFKAIRLYASAFNLLTWARQIKWSDPELNGNYTTYPPLRVINLGASVKF